MKASSLKVFMAIAAVALMLVAQVAYAGGKGKGKGNSSSSKKTTICHIPPGNPANAKTITVGNSAVPAHIENHGDCVGPCPCQADPCGDGECNENIGENCDTCATDCGACPSCGDGSCDAGNAEDCGSCPSDCGECPSCPDGICNGVENCETCPQDCGVPVCCFVNENHCNPADSCGNCSGDNTPVLNSTCTDQGGGISTCEAAN